MERGGGGGGERGVWEEGCFPMRKKGPGAMALPQGCMGNTTLAVYGGTSHRSTGSKADQSTGFDNQSMG